MSGSDGTSILTAQGARIGVWLLAACAAGLVIAVVIFALRKSWKLVRGTVSESVAEREPWSAADWYGWNSEHHPERVYENWGRDSGDSTAPAEALHRNRSDES